MSNNCKSFIEFSKEFGEDVADELCEIICDAHWSKSDVVKFDDILTVIETGEEEGVGYYIDKEATVYGNIYENPTLVK